MPRKLCWIEADEEGKAVGPLECFGLSSLVQRNVIEALPDATEEVVESVAKALAKSAFLGELVAWKDISGDARDVWRDEARALLARVVESTSPTKEE